MEQKYKKVAELYREGLSHREIAEAVGSTRGAIATLLCKQGLTRKKEMNDKSKLNQIIRMRQDGISIGEIAENMGWPENYIKRMLCEHGCGSFILSNTQDNKEDLAGLQYAEVRRPKFERLVIMGKRYVDVTEAFGI